MRRILLLTVLLLLSPAVHIVMAQNGGDAMTDGILAFREGRYSQAVNYFEQVIDEGGSDEAEAHFLLARIYFETEEGNRTRAEDELDKALILDPENIKYMVALMQSLRVDSWNFFQKRAREVKRGELARKILAIDSTNAFAHQELGKSYIRDFWRYRNAVVYPGLIFKRDPYLQPTVVDPLANWQDREQELFDLLYPDPGDGIEGDPNEPELGRVAGILDPQSLLMADQFDVEALEAQGINIQRLTSRADAAYELAIGHLYAAIESDPRQRDAYTDLMQIFALKGDCNEALRMLEQMYLFFPEDPELWTWLGFSHHYCGNLQAAAKVFETAMPLLDPDAYYAYNSLDIILSDEEKKEYEKDQMAYAARYWTSQDPRYLTPYNERKLEHYARLTYADLLYGSDELDLRGWNTERGQIIVRYGPPIGDVVVIPKSSSGVSSSIREVGITGNQLDDQPQSSSQILQIARDGWGWDMFEEANTYNIWDYGDKKFVFEDPFRNGEYRLYSPSAYDISQGSLPWANDYTIIAGETFREEPESYEYTAPGRQIELPFLVASFKNFESDLADVYVNYGIPVNSFEQGTDLLNVNANTGTFVVGENRDMLVEKRRTLYGLRTSQVIEFEESNLWVDTERLRVPPGSQEVSVEFETSTGNTVGVQRRDVEVIDFAGDNFSVSDLLLAYRIDENESGTATLSTDILRNGLSIQPAPWSVFSTDQPIYLYFEVYNLALDDAGVASYQVEAALALKKQGNVIGNILKGIFGGGEEGVAVATPVQVSSENDGQYLILDATNQEPGVYTLVLRITDEMTGEQLERQQDLFLE